MRPTRSKAARKLTKEGAQRIIGATSGWQAHKQHKCLVECWYCDIQRRVGNAVDRHGRIRPLIHRQFIEQKQKERSLIHVPR